ncbi:MAG: TetR/AcrR family transcriptional regulator [Polyangiales bacterium]
MKAARACFAQRGFAVTTNRDIADQAGVTAAAIYQYFDSKLALYLATTREAVADVAAHMRAHIATDDSTAGSLRGIVLSLLALHDADPSLTPFFAALRFELQRNPEIAKAIKPDRDELLLAMTEVVQLGVGRGELLAADVPRVVAMFVTCVIGLSQLATLLEHEQFAEAVGAFAQLLEGSLFRTPKRRRKPSRTRRRPRT